MVLSKNEEYPRLEHVCLNQEMEDKTMHAWKHNFSLDCQRINQ